MKALANYVMGGPIQAILVTTASALLSLLFLPFLCISGGALGLVTLRLGVQRGMAIAAWATAIVTLIGVLVVNSASVGLGFLMVLWLPVIAMAASLRRTVSLERSVMLAGFFGVGLVISIHVAAGDVSAWWQQALQEVLKGAGYNLTGDTEKLTEEAARLMTGVVSVLFSLGLTASIFVSRWWQAMLFNPGGFREEFHGLRLGKGLGYVTLALIAGFTLLDGQAGMICGDLLMVAGLLHLMQGVAIAHGLVARSGAAIGWLIGMYGLLVVALPETVVTLAMAGFADSWFDFRAFFRSQKED